MRFVVAPTAASAFAGSLLLLELPMKQPAARTAIEEYERIERERIHLSTAARVLNYDAEAQERKRKAAIAVANEEPEDARRLVHTWHPFPVCFSSPFSSCSIFFFSLPLALSSPCPSS